MTYKWIIDALRRGKLDATADGLERAIDDEAKALAELPGSKWNRRDNGKSAREAAQDFYAEDISSQVRDPQELTPARLISHRRVAVAWAVAEVLRTNGLAS